MGENGGIDVPGGSFSKLLLSSTSDDVEQKPSSLLCAPHTHSSVPQTPLFSCNTPNMLCFGDFNSKLITPKPTFTPVFSNDDTTKITNPISNNSNKRRNGSGKESGSGSGNGQKNGNGVMKKKKNNAEMGPIVKSSSNSVGHAKGRREKLGERISVLQQLVCPYGKTDTASVLHEAMGYIRFLHDQVKVLSTPYIKRLPSSWTSSPFPHQSLSENGAIQKDSTESLREMGLCLVPLECILQVTGSNGADFWPPTISSSGLLTRTHQV